MNIFVYGILCDFIVFCNLMGMDLNGVLFDLCGFWVDCVKDSDLLMILLLVDYVVIGLLLCDFDLEVIDCLYVYEVLFGYVLVMLD